MRERALRSNVQRRHSGYNAKPFSGLGALQTAVSFSAGSPACALFGALYARKLVVRANGRFSDLKLSNLCTSTARSAGAVPYSHTA